MKNLVIILLISFLFSSCGRVKNLTRIQKSCDIFAQVCVTSTEKETILKDTTIYKTDTLYLDKIIEVPLPSDTVFLMDTLPFAETDQVKDIPTRFLNKENGLVGVNVSGRWVSINVVGYLTDSTLLYNYKDTLTRNDSIRIYNAIRETTVKDTIVLPPEKYTSKFAKISMWIVSVLIGVGLILLFLYIKNKTSIISGIKKINLKDIVGKFKKNS